MLPRDGGVDESGGSLANRVLSCRRRRLSITLSRTRIKISPRAAPSNGHSLLLVECIDAVGLVFMAISFSARGRGVLFCYFAIIAFSLALILFSHDLWISARRTSR